MYDKEEKLPVALKYGLTIAGINIVWILLTFLMGVERTPSFVNGLLGLGVTVISIFLLAQSVRTIKSMQNGYLSFGDGFFTGSLTTIIGSTVYAIFMYIYFKMINTAFFEWVKEESLNNVDVDELDKVEDFLDVIMSPGFISILSGFFYFIGGLILSAIIAVMLHDKTPKHIETV